jgi:hypothetical protein
MIFSLLSPYPGGLRTRKVCFSECATPPARAVQVDNAFLNIYFSQVHTMTMHIKLCKSTAMYKFLKPLNLDGCHLEQFWRVISSEKPGDRGTWTCDLFTKLPPGQVYVQCLRFLTDCRILSSRREENFGQIIFSLFCGLEIERELMTWCPLFELSGNSRKKSFLMSKH